MHIAVLGTGNVGGTLGVAWAKQGGHRITFGSRNPDDDAVQTLVERAGNGAAAASYAAAVEAAEAVCLATPWQAAEEILGAIGDFGDRVLLDATNPLEMSDDGLGLAIGHSTSGGEKVAGWATNARVVKTLNQTGFENMAEPAFGGTASMMFYATDDEDAGGIAHLLLADLGFEPIAAGPLRNARLLEPLAMLWIDQALFRGAGRGFAFARLRR